ncbi:MAG TPA: MscL family protein [Streptosporangiaceae bacterium]|nr:MscL family protein [Streptosporangiaceae bacterium]
MFKGFRNFLLHGDVIVVAVGLAVALAFSTLISAFTNYVVKPLVARAEGSHSMGLVVKLGSSQATWLDFGQLISAIIYFAIFMAVIYYFIVVPYKTLQARRGTVVFGDPPPTKTCLDCLSDGLPVAASKCKFCGSDQPIPTGGL